MQAYIIIPAYEPDPILISLVKTILPTGHKIVVVDDGSGRRYSSIFQQLKPYCTVLVHTKNEGKGAAIKTALSYLLREDTDWDFIGIMDADGQHRPADMEKVLSYASKHQDGLTLGVRQIGNKMPLRSRFGNRITQLIFRLLSGIWVSDTQTGLRAFDRATSSKMLQIPGERYEYEMNVLMEFAKERIPIYETPIETLYEEGNKSSHFRVLKDSVRIYGNLFRFAGSSFLSFCLDYVLYFVFCLLFNTFTFGVFFSNLLARILSAFFNYKINCRFVFQEEGSTKTILQYTLLATGILICNSFLLKCYLLLGAGKWLGKLFTEITLFVASFLVQRFVIFREGSAKLGHR